MMVGSMNSSGNYCAPAVCLTPIYANRACHQEIYFHFRCQLWQPTLRLFQTNLERQASRPISALWKSWVLNESKLVIKKPVFIQALSIFFHEYQHNVFCQLYALLEMQSISKLLVRETDSYQDSIVIVYPDSDSIVIVVSPIVILSR